MNKFISIATATLLLPACCVTKQQPVVEIRDSVRVEIRERTVHDTLTVELPVIYERNVTDDTLSVIENDYAKSTAVVSNGHLYHDLQLKPTPIDVPVEYTAKDSVTTSSHTETITKTEYVEKELTKWQKRWITTGKASVTFFLLLLAAGLVKLLRK